MPLFKSMQQSAALTSVRDSFKAGARSDVLEYSLINVVTIGVGVNCPLSAWAHTSLAIRVAPQKSLSLATRA